MQWLCLLSAQQAVPDLVCPYLLGTSWSSLAWHACCLWTYESCAECRQLTQGWAGVLTNWAAVGSLSAAHAARYQSAWMPGAALPEPVPDQDKLACAAPAMLIALAATLSTTQVHQTAKGMCDCEPQVTYSWPVALCCSHDGTSCTAPLNEAALSSSLKDS